MPPEMGALVTRALRPVRSFNIENRAHRIIAKEKPTPAPTYPQNVEDLKRTLEADPGLTEKLDKKDSDLDERLRNVYVTSHGKPEDDITRDKQRSSTQRPLPEHRGIVEDFELGFKEPERIPYGRTTLRQVMNFISAHQTDPTMVTASKIAEEHKLNEQYVEDVLKYFKTYEIYLPETKHTKAVFAGPANARKQMEETLRLSNIAVKHDDTFIQRKKLALGLEKLEVKQDKAKQEKDVEHTADIFEKEIKNEHKSDTVEQEMKSGHRSDSIEKEMKNENRSDSIDKETKNDYMQEKDNEQEKSKTDAGLESKKFKINN